MTKKEEKMSEGCGLCHCCGTPIIIVLDGEEWCQKCKTYRRYPSHGFGHGACSQGERESICKPKFWVEKVA